MRILFITSTRIGDAVLSTGLVRHFVDKYVDAKITIACGPLVADLFRGVPNLETLHIITKRPFNRHWIDLWKKVVGTRWDIVVDIRNSAVSRLIWAGQRYIMGPHIDKHAHKVAQMAQVMRLPYVPAPKLWLTDDVCAIAAQYLPKDDGRKVLALGPAANWLAKTWPAERFIELTRRLIADGAPFAGARIAVLAAPHERAQVQPVLDAFAGACVDLVGIGSPLQAAAFLERADFYIGNDSGLLHTAAALELSCVGLYGPSWPEIYGPYGPHAAYVRTPKNFAELIDYDGYTPDTAPCLMDGITVDMVEDKVRAILLDATQNCPE